MVAKVRGAALEVGVGAGDGAALRWYTTFTLLSKVECVILVLEGGQYPLTRDSRRLMALVLYAGEIPVASRSGSRA